MKSFFHPVNGYWEADPAPPADILAAYPMGTVEVPRRPGLNHLWQDGAWVPGPPQPVYPDLETALAAMLTWINGFAASLTGPMPEAEVRSLPVKAAAARAYLAASATAEQTAMLQAEADLTGEVLADLAAEIAANADRDDQVNARISGLRRALKVQLEAAADPFAFEAILEAGKLQALAMAAELGIAAPS